MGEYVEEVTLLEERIHPIFKGIKIRYPRWISTPDGDQGEEWCSDCGYYKVRNLRRRDRKRRTDYILDGGWRTEEDHFCNCVACGVILDVSLTDYGLEEAVRTFEECGLSTSTQVDAYEIGEMLRHVSFRHDGETAEGDERRAAIVAIAEKFLASRLTGESTGEAKP